MTETSTYRPRHDVNVREGRPVNYLLQKCLDRYEGERNARMDAESAARAAARAAARRAA